MRDFIDKEKRSTIMETSKIERLRDMKKNEEKQQETAKEKMSRKKLLCVIGIPVGILVVIYLVLALFFQSHFAFRTTINNVGVSASSTSGVEKKITKQASRYEMKLVEREDKTESISGTDIDMEPVFDKQVKELLKKQNGFAWPYYLISPQKYEAETMISFDEEKLKDVLDHLSCMDESKWTDSENAQIKDYTKDGYEVQPEVYGTKIDKDAFTEKIKEALDKMQPEFDLSGEGCYDTLVDISKEWGVSVESILIVQLYNAASFLPETVIEVERIGRDTMGKWDDTCGWISFSAALDLSCTGTGKQCEMAARIGKAVGSLTFEKDGLDGSEPEKALTWNYIGNIDISSDFDSFTVMDFGQFSGKNTGRSTPIYFTVYFKKGRLYCNVNYDSLIYTREQMNSFQKAFLTNVQQLSDNYNTKHTDELSSILEVMGGV